MRRSLLAAATLFCALSLVAVACGGDDGDNGDDGTTTPGASRTVTRTGTASGTGTAASGSPGTATAVPSIGTITPEEATAIAASGNIQGGSEDQPPVVVATVPPVAPPANATAVVDPTQIAPPDPQANDLRLIIDTDAAAAGIQSSRDVRPGDTIRVAVVLANAPPYGGGAGGGVSAFQFTVNYDKTKIVAPTIAGGPAIDRNPDLNEPVLGEGWTCLPAPEGDLDDPIGNQGDGNPATGEAMLSCFSPDGTAGGTLVLGVVTFQAVATGSTELSLTDVVVGDTVGLEVARCESGGNEGEPIVPCVRATINVR